jgi:formylglycine-generating enzyme required for sulfatase activity
MGPLLLLLFFFALAAGGQEAVQVAVVAEGGPAEVTSYVQALVEKELGASGKFILVERSRVEEVLKEMAFQQSGVTVPEKAAQIGQHLNVEKLIFVQTHRLHPHYELTLRVVEVSTNQVLRVEKESLGRLKEEIQAGTRRAARRLIAAAGLLSPAQMILIPAGRFAMGSAHGLPDEQPPHSVSISAFYLDAYEVSRMAFEEFLVAQGRKARADVRDPDLPATGVSWHDAVAYCGSRGGRLPTEAEWEYAARGPQGRTYPWGETLPNPSLARFAGQERGPLLVVSLPEGATPEGVHHLGGNAAEWTQDWWDPGYYARSPAQDPRGPAEGDFRAVRGGSWNQPADELRASARAYHNPDRGDGHLGFRCARDASSP